MSDPAWSIEVGEHGVRWLRSTRLAEIPGLIHGFSLAPGDFGGWPPEAGPAETVRRRFVRAIGGGTQPTLGVRQVHGSAIFPWSGEPTQEPAVLEGDGRVAERPVAGGALLEVRMADCVPVLLADPRGRAVAAIHSGWRGTAAGIVPQAVRWFAERGWQPDRLVAAVGPAICGSHYEVGPEVFEAVATGLGTTPESLQHPRPGAGRPGIDLRSAIEIQLNRAGIGPERLSVAGWCTYEHPELFHSYRRQGSRAGRMAACIGWPVP